MTNQLEPIIAAWSGKEKLWKVFWLYNFILGTAIGYAIDYVAGLGLIIEIAVFTVVLIWAIWVLVALWRCAFNSRWRGWGYVCRGVVVLSLGVAALKVIGPFVGVHMEPI